MVFEGQKSLERKAESCTGSVISKAVAGRDTVQFKSYLQKIRDDATLSSLKPKQNGSL